MPCGTDALSRRLDVVILAARVPWARLGKDHLRHGPALSYRSDNRLVSIQRLQIRPRFVRFVCLAGGGGVVVWLLSCQPHGFGARTADRPIPSDVSIRDIRVLLADDASACRIRIAGPHMVCDAKGRVIEQRTQSGWMVADAGSNGLVRLNDQDFGLDEIEILPSAADAAVEISIAAGSGWDSPRRYAGSLRLSVEPGQRMRIVNHVNLETYVACVLPGELFPHFETEAYRAQAVAVRTYALYQMSRKGHRAFDLDASQSSQVYPGLPSGKNADRAGEAAAYTRGIVATWDSPQGPRIFCTYYSSCCGGLTQRVVDSKRDEADIPPLSGGVRCACLTVATDQKYRWGTLRLTKQDVSQQLVKSYPKLASLGGIDRIEVAEKSKSGRPKTFRLVGVGGKKDSVGAEDFRLSVGSTRLRSTNCRVYTDKNHIVFADGKGFGHGMGMCQWGMQAMAKQGRRAGDILQHYYPQSRLTRAY